MREYLKNDKKLRSEIETRTNVQLDLETKEDCAPTKSVEDAGWDDDSAVPLHAIIREEFGVEITLTDIGSDHHCVNNNQVLPSTDGLQANADEEDIWKYDEAGNLWGEGHLFEIISS